MSVIARAGDHSLPGEAVVAEEAAVSEAIHGAAHPGRTRAASDATASADAPAASDDAPEADAVTADDEPAAAEEPAS